MLHVPLVLGAAVLASAIVTFAAWAIRGILIGDVIREVGFDALFEIFGQL